MTNYKYILFDWDGCLAKTLEVWLDAYKTSLKNFNSEPADDEVASHFGDWELPKYFGIKNFERCNEEAVQIARKKLEKVELYEGAEKILAELKGQARLALLSSSSRDILEQGVNHNGLGSYFDVILAGEDVVNHKPHPEVINRGLDRINGSKEEAVMIGDSRKDLGAARNAKVDSILVYPPSHQIFYNLEELKTYSPTFICDSLEAVKDILVRNI